MGLGLILISFRILWRKDMDPSFLAFSVVTVV